MCSFQYLRRPRCVAKLLYFHIVRGFDPHRPYHRILLIPLALREVVGNTPTAHEKISLPEGREVGSSVLVAKIIRGRSVFTGQRQSGHRAVRLRNYPNCFVGVRFGNCLGAGIRAPAVLVLVARESESGATKRGRKEGRDDVPASFLVLIFAQRNAGQSMKSREEEIGGCGGETAPRC